MKMSLSDVNLNKHTNIHTISCLVVTSMLFRFFPLYLVRYMLNTRANVWTKDNFTMCHTQLWALCTLFIFTVACPHTLKQATLWLPLPEEIEARNLSKIKLPPGDQTRSFEFIYLFLLFETGSSHIAQTVMSHAKWLWLAWYLWVSCYSHLNSGVTSA